MTGHWNLGLPGGPAGPFYSIVSDTGFVVALQIPDRETAQQIIDQHNAACPICGGTNGEHKPIGGTVSKEPLTVDDWRELYEFLRDVELPFVHNLSAKARARKQAAAPQPAGKDGQE